MLATTVTKEVLALVTSNPEQAARLRSRLGTERKKEISNQRVSDICSLEYDRVDSPSLRLEKFVHLGNDSKKAEVDAVVACHNRRSPSPEFTAERFADVPGAAVLHLRLASRLIVNQAGGVLENAGLCLHRHFGFPYIPGSAVKGAARHAAWLRWDEAKDNEHARRLALTFGFPTGDPALDKTLETGFPGLFGRKGRFHTLAGAVRFFPAYPEGKVRLVTDIVNCHHPHYYQGKKKRATDDENPNPQFFPAVEADSAFVFTLAPVPGRTEQIRTEFGFDPLAFARDALVEGLDVAGIGAKTAAGYGWFTVDHEAQRAWEEKRRNEMEARRGAEAERERLEKMSPEERRIHELGKLSRDEFIEKIKALPKLDEQQQRDVIRALLEKHRDLWDKDKKAKPKKKAGQRAAQVREIAAKLGIELP